MWLSATEGDKDSKLARRDHWPETELVNNETKMLKAIETIWRDFYKGQRLEIWQKSYYNLYHDARYEDTYLSLMDTARSGSVKTLISIFFIYPTFYFVFSEIMVGGWNLTCLRHPCKQLIA